MDHIILTIKNNSYVLKVIDSISTTHVENQVNTNKTLSFCYCNGLCIMWTYFNKKTSTWGQQKCDEMPTHGEQKWMTVPQSQGQAHS